MYIFIFIILVGMFYIIQKEYHTRKYILHPNTAKIMINHKIITTIIDVRTNIEYNTGRYPNSIHIPNDEISIQNEKVKTIIKQKLKEYNTKGKVSDILIYCRTGRRAEQARNTLQNIFKQSLYHIPNIFIIQSSYTNLL